MLKHSNFYKFHCFDVALIFALLEDATPSSRFESAEGCVDLQRPNIAGEFGRQRQRPVRFSVIFLCSLLCGCAHLVRISYPPEAVIHPAFGQRFTTWDGERVSIGLFFLRSHIAAAGLRQALSGALVTESSGIPKVQPKR